MATVVYLLLLHFGLLKASFPSDDEAGANTFSDHRQYPPGQEGRPRGQQNPTLLVGVSRLGQDVGGGGAGGQANVVTL